jgi:trehalose 6-phosphate phosphatase
MTENPIIHGSHTAIKKLHDAERLRLFLDYDGTLSEFAPTPDEIYPDPQLIDLLEMVNNRQHIQVAVISGRRLSHIQKLLPIKGIILAGTYGIELLQPDGKRIDRLNYKQIRPSLEQLKPLWESIISKDKNFYLEDKGWSLAIHARYVDSKVAERLLADARIICQPLIESTNVFRLLGGDKFLEVAPKLANKGLTIDYLLSIDPLRSQLAVYIGDDDKDEEAFGVIINNDGIAIKVSSQPSITKAQIRLDSPKTVRQFLVSLL